MLKFRFNETPDFDFNTATKKPIPVKCIQIQEAFQVESLEGTVTGKAGDWLMIGIDGEKYICDDAIFKRTYDLQE
ncbi:hypothetical protein [Aequorivita capsosiphonis]|uniref:hypothetical protein n=1 Tax=Aequorivita capsosiphonis TaxID=487317 RepID=UPI00040CFB4A|nr:hypothetical protein [Aequorivita capsosiphonis]